MTAASIDFTINGITTADFIKGTDGDLFAADLVVLSTGKSGSVAAGTLVVAGVPEPATWAMENSPEIDRDRSSRPCPSKGKADEIGPATPVRFATIQFPFWSAQPTLDVETCPRGDMGAFVGIR
jgi:hypothetical protein